MRAKIAEVAVTGQSRFDEVERAFVGKRNLVNMIISSVLAGRHILLKDYP